MTDSTPAGIRMATVGLVIVQNRKLLLAFSKNKNCFYLPGGKIDSNESSEDALRREIAEELNVVLEKQDLKFYVHISAPAFGEMDGTVMEQDVYFADKEMSPYASAEIGEIKYFTLDEYLNESKQAPGAVMMLQRLKMDGYID